jgi:hypothetical protein
MNVLEQRFMEQMPRLLHDLLEEVEQLTNEVAELRKELADIRFLAQNL